MKTFTKTLGATVATLSITLAFVPQARAQSFLTNGLVAYYPFYGNANDESGNGNNLTNYGATLCPDRFGNANQAYSFNGSGSYLGSATPPLFQVDNWTMSAWIQPAVLPQRTAFAVCVGENAAVNSGFGFGIAGVGGGVSSGNELCGFVPGIAFNDGGYSFSSTNAWYHVAMSRTFGVTTFYVNGVLTPNSNTTTPILPGAIEIGSAGNGFGYFNGAVDDVRIYNRALSSNEVQQLYQYESDLSPCTPNSAVAVATVAYGYVSGATVVNSGCGFTNTPLVLIQGGGGTGATAIAVVSNGVLATIIVTDAGSGYTSAPIIYIGNVPSITNQPQSVTVNADSAATLNVAATGGDLNYEWSLNGTNIPGATASSLAFTNVMQTNLGTYDVVVTNVFGAVTSSPAILTMYPFLADPFSGLETLWGYTNTLEVQAWGTGPLDYQWFDNGIAIDGATNSSLTFAGIQPTNSGLYTVVVSNPFGSVTNTPEQVIVEPAGISLAFFPSIIIDGTAGYTYVIQRTADLSNTNSWTTVTNLTLTEPTQIWTDYGINTTQPGNPQQYYRVLAGP